MTKITIYTGLFCGFCDRAKYLLQSKSIPYNEINIALHPSRRHEMFERTGGWKTVPQLFLEDQHIGGCDDLFALDRSGRLDEMLNLPGAEQTVKGMTGEAKASA